MVRYPLPTSATISGLRSPTQTLKWDSGYRDALYNKNDGLFCVLSFDGSMLTLDPSDPSSPVAKDIVLAADRWFFSFHSAKRV